MLPNTGGQSSTRSCTFILMRDALFLLRYLTFYLVPPPGIEPGSTALQTVAMTTSAKAAWGVL